MKKYQEYTVIPEYPEKAATGQLVFAGDDSDEVVGFITEVEGDVVTVWLIEPRNYPLPDYVLSAKSPSESRSIHEVFAEMEVKVTGLCKWIANLDPTDWRIGCPL